MYKRFMTDREAVLGGVGVGDIVAARYLNGAGVLALIVDVTDRILVGRDITRQDVLQFDRRTGIAASTDASDCTIWSAARLPPETVAALLGLDRKYGSGRPLSDEEARLTSAEKEAFAVSARLHRANPI